MKVIMNLYNVSNKVINLTQIFQDTPLDAWYKSGVINNSPYRVYHLSDALRLTVLWKNGGTYLDTDVITTCPLTCFRNVLSMATPTNVANGVLFFDKFNPFLKTCMEDFAGDYRMSEWAHHGPTLVTRNLKRICKGRTLESVINKPEACSGIRVMPAQTFIPIEWRKWERIFTEDYTRFNLNDSYTVHLFGSLSRKTKVAVNSRVLLEVLAINNCPETYKFMVGAQEI